MYTLRGQVRMSVEEYQELLAVAEEYRERAAHAEEGWREALDLAEERDYIVQRLREKLRARAKADPRWPRDWRRNG